MDSEQVKQL